MARSRRIARRYRHAGGRLADLERRGDVLVRELFEVPHQHHFTVGVVERFDRRLKTLFELMVRGRRGRRQLDRAPAPPGRTPIGRSALPRRSGCSRATFRRAA